MKGIEAAREVGLLSTEQEVDLSARAIFHQSPGELVHSYIPRQKGDYEHAMVGFVTASIL